VTHLHEASDISIRAFILLSAQGLGCLLSHASGHDVDALPSVKFSTKEPEQMGSSIVGSREFTGNANRHAERFHEWGEAVLELRARTLTSMGNVRFA